MGRKQSEGKAREPETVTLTFADHRINSWDFEVEGVDEIRDAEAGGTEVPADKEEEVREAAQAKGIELKRVDE